jgi:TetR/AcrR family transcriptional repressor of nem operon
MEIVMTAAAPTRERLLSAALDLVRRRGFAATSVEDLCRAAEVTKGAFFHHFASKEALGIAAAEHWSEVTGAFFATAPYHAHADPLDRFLGYIDFRAAIIAGGIGEFTCLVGTMAQEVWDSSPAIAAACAASMTRHAGTLEADIAAAAAARGLTDIDAPSLALHTQAVLQGGFVLAKAAGDPGPARAAAAHLRRYVELLFHRGKAQPRDGQS